MSSACRQLTLSPPLPSPRGATALGQERRDGLQIGLGVDADRRLRRLDDDDVDPVLEEPQLLELLAELERRLRQTMERVERRRALQASGLLRLSQGGARRVPSFAAVERRLAIGVEALMLEAHGAD